MGTSVSAKQLSAKMTQAGKRVDRASREAIGVAAKETKRVTLGLMAQATGGDLILSGTTRTTGPKRTAAKSTAKGKIGVRYKVEQRATGAQAFVAATGPAQLVENDVKKHPVVSRYARTSEGVQYVTKKGAVRSSRANRQVRGIAVMAGIATTGDRRAVLHWGNRYARYTVASSKGRHPWERGMTAMRPRVPQIVAQANRRALIKEFG